MAGIASGASGSPPGSPASVALRPLGTFPPRRVSVFEDPGDERSWHFSQTFEGLMRFYEGREPDWYASAIAPLVGCESVVELGCGPVLALRALRNRGVRRVLGLDRWPGFADIGRRHGIPVLLHDLTLPMPFLRSSSIDGVLSHFALDYVSPVGVLQALRECRRILAPGGRVVVHAAAIGQATGDFARTVRYTPAVMEQLFRNAGFDEVEIRDMGRNTTSIAVAGPAPPDAHDSTTQVTAETQISAGFATDPGDVVVELTARSGSTSLRVPAGAERPEELGLNAVAACARLIRPHRHAWELQVCVWRGGHTVTSRAVRLSEQPRTMSIAGGGAVEHISMWKPDPLDVGAAGHAFVPSAEAAPDDRPSIAVAGALDADAPANHETVRVLDLRSAPRKDVAALESAWRAGALGGILLDAETTNIDEAPLMWACARGALVLIRCVDWGAGMRAAAAIPVKDPPPVLVLDPGATSGRTDLEGFDHALARAAELDYVQLVLDRATIGGRALSPDQLPALLLASGDGGGPLETLVAAENLRYLCERARLLSLRAQSRRTLEELGRMPSLDQAS